MSRTTCCYLLIVQAHGLNQNMSDLGKLVCSVKMIRKSIMRHMFPLFNFRTEAKHPLTTRVLVCYRYRPRDNTPSSMYKGVTSPFKHRQVLRSGAGLKVQALFVGMFGCARTASRMIEPPSGEEV